MEHKGKKIVGCWVKMRCLHVFSEMWRTNDGVCRSFVHLANTVSLSAETLRKVGDGYRAEECQQACVDSTDFVCVAAQMQLPATCFVMGFRLRNDYMSVHYTRVCQHGQCHIYLRVYSAQLNDAVLLSWKSFNGRFRSFTTAGRSRISLEICEITKVEKSLKRNKKSRLPAHRVHFQRGEASVNLVGKRNKKNKERKGKHRTSSVTTGCLRLHRRHRW